MSVYITPRVVNPFAKISTRDLAEIRHKRCENCGKRVDRDNCWPEKNHCLVPDRKRYKPVCDYGINMELVCAVCHKLELVHTYEHRVAFKRKQEERYSVEDVQAFFSMLESLGYYDDGIASA